MTQADGALLLQAATFFCVVAAIVVLARLARRIERLERRIDGELVGKRRDSEASSETFRSVALDRHAGANSALTDAITHEDQIEEAPRTVATDELSQLAGRFQQEKQQGKRQG